MHDTIFITFPNSYSVRNIIHTGVLHTIASKGGGPIVVYLAGNQTEQLRLRVPENVVIKHLPAVPSVGVSKMLQLSLAGRFYRIKNSESYSTRVKYDRSVSGTRFIVKTALTWPFPRSRKVFRVLEWLDRRIGRVPKYVREQFIEYSPSLVLATDPNAPAEYEFLRHSVRLGIRSAGLVRSWDVPSTKGWFPVLPDDVIVWSEWVAEKVQELHELSESRLHVVGAPQFDIYAKPVSDEMVTLFRKRMGLRGDLPVVLYASSPPRITTEEPRIVARLADELDGEAEIVLRIHPQDDLDRWTDLNRLNICKQITGTQAEGFDGGRLMGKEDLDDLSVTLACANVVASAWSTMLLDASAMKKPSVAMSFDDRPKPFHLSVQRFEHSHHTNKVIESGAVAVARSFEELIGHIRADIADPTRRRCEMANLVRLMCGSVDGMAGERLANTVLTLAGHRASPTVTR